MAPDILISFFLALPYLELTVFSVAFEDEDSGLKFILEGMNFSPPDSSPLCIKGEMVLSVNK